MRRDFNEKRARKTKKKRECPKRVEMATGQNDWLGSEDAIGSNSKAIPAEGATSFAYSLHAVDVV